MLKKAPPAISLMTPADTPEQEEVFGALFPEEEKHPKRFNPSMLKAERCKFMISGTISLPQVGITVHFFHAQCSSSMDIF